MTATKFARPTAIASLLQRIAGQSKTLRQTAVDHLTEAEGQGTTLDNIETALGRTVAVSVFSGLDTNSTSSATTALDVSEHEWVGVEVVGVTGTHGTHVLAMRGRVAAAGTMKLVRAAGIDNLAYSDVYWQISGQNSLLIPVHGFSEVDWKVVLAEGAVSTCDVHVRRWR